MSKKVILTGIRANNDLTIGNYFGAILPIIDMAKTKSDEYQVNLFVPDLHSFTTPVDHSTLQQQIQHNLRVFVAAGLPLNNSDVHIYRQSYVPAHSELTWILDCFTGVGEMKRMTQFKDKSGVQLGRNDSLPDKLSYKGKSVTAEELQEIMGAYEDFINRSGEFRNENRRREESVSVGLFNYPVLMAADILLYGASYVPVGDDQTQHLEFTRDIAERMNNKLDQELFVIPEPVKNQHTFFGKDQGLRIKDLQDPTKKMSKSDDSSKGVVFLGDSPEQAAKKIMSAATDSIGSINLDWENQPGISNLLQILALLTNRGVGEVELEWKGKSSYGDLKNEVATSMQNFLATFQDNLEKVDDNAITDKLTTSEKAMNDQANSTLLKTQKAVGLR